MLYFDLLALILGFRLRKYHDEPVGILAVINYI